MPDIARLRSTPSMERLWAAAERDEEERLKREVEKDIQAKMVQRQVDTQEIAERRKAEITEMAELIQSNTVAPKRKQKTEIGCLHVTSHYCLKLLGFCAIIITVAFLSKLSYSLYLEYKLVHERLSIVLTGDPGTDHRNSEQYLLERHLTGKDVAVLTDSLCENIYHGWLYGQRVILATTGKGHDRAAVCLTSLLATWGGLTNEVIFAGTGGFSAARGGIINSDDCEQKEEHGATKLLTMIGDVCVTQTVTNWENQECMFPDSVSSACFAAPCTRHSQANMFGQMETGFHASPSLASEVVKSMATVQLPSQPSAVQRYSDRYWSAMSEGGGATYSTRSTPKLFTSKSCAEASSDLSWSGAAFDEVARSYIATEISQQGAVVGKRDVIAVEATEGIGWMSALFYYEKNGHKVSIPSVNIRGAANHVHPPLIRSLFPSGEEHDTKSQVIWSNDNQWASIEELDEYAELSYEYAVNTTSAVVLSLFQHRQATGKGAHANSMLRR